MRFRGHQPHVPGKGVLVKPFPRRDFPVGNLMAGIVDPEQQHRLRQPVHKHHPGLHLGSARGMPVRFRRQRVGFRCVRGQHRQRIIGQVQPPAAIKARQGDRFAVRGKIHGLEVQPTRSCLMPGQLRQDGGNARVIKRRSPPAGRRVHPDELMPAARLVKVIPELVGRPIRAGEPVRHDLVPVNHRRLCRQGRIPGQHQP